MSDIQEVENRLKKIREYSSGAIRDSSIGKPNCHDLQGYTILRFGYHMELGEQNYGQSNYLKGIPDEDVKESLARHYAKLMDNWDDEDHACAIIFNIQLLMLNQKNKGIPPDYYYKRLNKFESKEGTKEHNKGESVSEGL